MAPRPAGDRLHSGDPGRDAHVGRPDDGTDVTSYYNLEFNAPLIPMEEWRKKQVKIFGKEVWRRSITREEIQDELMKKFEIFPLVDFNFSQLIRDNVEEALSAVKGANSIKLFGNDLNVLEMTGQRVINILNTVPGISNAGLFHIVGQPDLEIQIDRHECPATGSMCRMSKQWSRSRWGAGRLPR